MTNHLERTVKSLQIETRGIEPDCDVKKKTYFNAIH